MDITKLKLLQQLQSIWREMLLQTALMETKRLRKSFYLAYEEHVSNIQILK